MNISLANQTNTPLLPEDKIFVAIIGRSVAPDGSAGCWSYLTRSASLIKCESSDNAAGYFFTLADLKAQNYTISNVPPIISGRVYVSYGQALQISVKQDVNQPCGLGIAFPNISDIGDPNYRYVFDKIEFTLNPAPDGSLWVNTTQVDFFSVPLHIVVTGGQNGTQTSGQLTGGRQALFQSFATSPGKFPNLVVKTDQGNPLTQNARVTAPAKLPPSIDFPADYFKPNIDALWQAYAAGASLTLSLVGMGGPAEITSATGKVTGWVPGGGGVFAFTDNLGNAYSIAYPSSANVFACDGDHVFNIDVTLPAQPTNLQAVDGNIKKQIAAALNRSVASAAPATWCGNPGNFYQQPITNHYSAIFHANTAGGCYGFAYDDVCEHSSTLQDSRPTGLQIVLAPFA